VVIIDADSVADPGFLSVMNYYLEHGSRAVQCSDLVAPLPDAWSSEITRFGFTLYNYVRPLARKLLGCTAGVRGNGMCFTSSTLRSIPWNTYSLNEDLEYGLILLLNGVNVDFAPEAKVLATMPATARNAESQRSRWERGRFPVIKLYAMKLLAKGVQSFSLRYIDAFLELMTPPFVNLFGAVSLMFVLHLAFLFTGISSSVALPALWGSFIVLGLLHVFAGLYAADADAALYKAFFHIPRYALWKIKLYLMSLRRPSTEEWIRTTRDQSVAPKSPDSR
jgi:cellulose synthase/poly-beta-1,6-N-acetylglucosamine synthase-like glycosyltransferase